MPKTTHVTTALVTLAFSALLSARSSGQNLVVNGSFETPVISDATYAMVPATNASPWKTSGGTFEFWANGMQVDGSQPTFSAHGRQNIEVLGGGDAIWQAIATVPNENYVLSFYHSPRATVHSQLTVSVGSKEIATLDENGTGLAGFQWKRFTAKFTATSTSTVVRFSDTAPTGAGTHLDDVVITVAPQVEHAIYRFTHYETMLGGGTTTPIKSSGFAVFEPDTTRGVQIAGFRLNNRAYFIIKPLYNYISTQVSGPNGATYTVIAKGESPGTQFDGSLLESSYLRGRNTLLSLGWQTRNMPRTLAFQGRGLSENPATHAAFATEARGTYILDLSATQLSNLAGESFAATVARYSNSFAASGYLELKLAPKQ
jgi:hypothetical protein